MKFKTLKKKLLKDPEVKKEYDKLSRKWDRERSAFKVKATKPIKAWAVVGNDSVWRLGTGQLEIYAKRSEAVGQAEELCDLASEGYVYPQKVARAIAVLIYPVKVKK